MNGAVVGGWHEVSPQVSEGAVLVKSPLEVELVEGEMEGPKGESLLLAVGSLMRDLGLNRMCRSSANRWASGIILSLRSLSPMQATSLTNRRKNVNFGVKCWLLLFFGELVASSGRLTWSMEKG